jgi:hypothetical protein
MQYVAFGEETCEDSGIYAEQPLFDRAVVTDWIRCVVHLLQKLSKLGRWNFG